MRNGFLAGLVVLAVTDPPLHGPGERLVRGSVRNVGAIGHDHDFIAT